MFLYNSESVCCSPEHSGAGNDGPEGGAGRSRQSDLLTGETRHFIHPSVTAVYPDVSLFYYTAPFLKYMLNIFKIIICTAYLMSLTFVFES